MKSIFIALLTATLVSFLFATGPGNVSSGLQMWLDASTLTLSDNDPVSSWTDQSGIGNNAVQDSTSIQPKFRTGIVNGKPAIVFPGKSLGTGPYLSYNGSIVVNTNYSIFAVLRRATGSASNHFFLGGTNASASKNLHAGWRSNNTFTHAHYSNDYNMKVNSYTTQENPFIVSLRHSNTLGNDTYIDGGLRGLNMLEASRKAHLTEYAGASIGRYVGSNFNSRFNGWVAEYIVYNRYLSETERKAVESYLSGKYAITIADTESPEHYTNMFSLSVSSPNFLAETKESGGLSITGIYKAASASIRTGHNNAEGIASNFNPAINTYPDFFRLKREWFLEITGTLDTEFSFDLDALGLGDISPTGNSYCLLFRNNSKDNFTVINSIATINGKVISFNQSSLVVLNNNGFYTLGTLDNGVSTLPIELSSFTATISTQNFVNLMWITQSETGVSGFYIYRNNRPDISLATLISPLIPASNTSQTQSYVFTDTEITNDGSYYYWLQTLDFDGSNAFHGPVTLIYTTGGNHGTPVIPPVTELKRIFPNPFNPSAFISYGLAAPTEVSIKIYNNRGQMIRSLQNCPSTIGNHRLEWNGKDDNGIDCSSGVYILRMKAGNQSFSQRAILVK